MAKKITFPTDDYRTAVDALYVEFGDKAYIEEPVIDIYLTPLCVEKLLFTGVLKPKDKGYLFVR